jgi:hypothetical protein
MPASDSSSALFRATAIGTVVQLAMVLAGHYNAGIAQMFAVGGMTISLAAGVLYALWAKRASWGASAVGGAIAGGVCALLGIIVSYVLGDVTASILALGTLSSAVTGLVGGLLGHALASRKSTAPA